MSAPECCGKPMGFSEMRNEPWCSQCGRYASDPPRPAADFSTSEVSIETEEKHKLRCTGVGEAMGTAQAIFGKSLTVGKRAVDALAREIAERCGDRITTARFRELLPDISDATKIQVIDALRALGYEDQTPGNPGEAMVRRGTPVTVGVDRQLAGYTEEPPPPIGKRLTYEIRTKPPKVDEEITYATFKGQKFPIASLHLDAEEIKRRMCVPNKESEKVNPMLELRDAVTAVTAMIGLQDRDTPAHSSDNYISGHTFVCCCPVELVSAAKFYLQALGYEHLPKKDCWVQRGPSFTRHCVTVDLKWLSSLMERSKTIEGYVDHGSIPPRIDVATTTKMKDE